MTSKRLSMPMVVYGFENSLVCISSVVQFSSCCLRTPMGNCRLENRFRCSSMRPASKNLSSSSSQMAIQVDFLPNLDWGFYVRLIDER
ncbi:hypothetical protein HanPI659440_Chr01g0032491 [Helianthus annuus]|nr:hypothetical protein HanPI659440_Chr01g0032491 [Helianthus annuus]